VPARSEAAQAGGASTDAASAADAVVLRSIQRLYNIGLKPEWWKLAPLSAAGWAELGRLVEQYDPHCRGAVLLGLNQPLQALAHSFGQARHPVVKGFMVGRTLWADPALNWLGCPPAAASDAALVDQVAANFAALIDAWRASRA
jgi:5-dehydro-2-deoxygluconokinase